jgi:predicted N-acetyltransferase YhbS
MEIIRTIEFDISKDTHQQITQLRNSCFPVENAKPRSYYKQLPHFRYLVLVENTLVAHLGVDHRVIRVGDSIFTIFGVVDLCVKSSYRQQGIASKLLSLLTELAREKSVDFLFSVVKDKRIYLKHSFQTISHYCSWLRIHEHNNYGVAIEKIEGELMIKQTGNQPWINEPIDLLGYMF